MARSETLRKIWWRTTPPGDVMLPVLGTGAVLTALVGLVVYGNWESLSDGDGVGRDRATYIARLSAEERFQHDFNGYKDSGDNCLEQTGYDLWDSGHNKLIAIGTLTVKDGVYTVEPSGNDKAKPPLQLRADDRAVKTGHEPLQPYDDKAAEILSQYGCALSYAA